jgi:hypothetical protein
MGQGTKAGSRTDTDNGVYSADGRTAAPSGCDTSQRERVTISRHNADDAVKHRRAAQFGGGAAPPLGWPLLPGLLWSAWC